MTDQEIATLIAEVQFPPAKDGEVIVNVPMTVPKAIFPDQALAFAKARGWTDKHPMTYLKFIADMCRMRLRKDFETFVKDQATKQAQAQADLAIKGIFGA